METLRSASRFNELMLMYSLQDNWKKLSLLFSRSAISQHSVDQKLCDFSQESNINSWIVSVKKINTWSIYYRKSKIRASLFRSKRLMMTCMLWIQSERRSSLIEEPSTHVTKNGVGVLSVMKCFSFSGRNLESSYVCEVPIHVRNFDKQVGHRY